MRKQKYKFKDLFPRGELNEEFAQYFNGNSYTSRLTNFGVNMINVTFEAECRNNWHIHTAKTGCRQRLVSGVWNACA